LGDHAREPSSPGRRNTERSISRSEWNLSVCDSLSGRIFGQSELRLDIGCWQGRLRCPLLRAQQDHPEPGNFRTDESKYPGVGLGCDHTWSSDIGRVAGTHPSEPGPSRPVNVPMIEFIGKP
jgi:hypothetical protein